MLFLLTLRILRHCVIQALTHLVVVVLVHGIQISASRIVSQFPDIIRNPLDVIAIGACILIVVEQILG